MDPEERARREKEVAEAYLEQHGPDAAKIRECVLRIGSRGSESISVEDIWVDKKLEKQGLYRIDEEAYIKWIYGAKEGSTPWLLMFAWTPYGTPKNVFQTTELMMKKLHCTKEAFGDRLNIGFLDYGKDEFVKEAFDIENRRLGQMASVVVFIKDGVVYHTRQNNHSPEVFSAIVNT